MAREGLVFIFLLPVSLLATSLDPCHVLLERLSHEASSTSTQSIPIAGGGRYKRLYITSRGSLYQRDRIIFGSDREFKELPSSLSLEPEYLAGLQEAYQLGGSGPILLKGFLPNKRGELSKRYIALLPEDLSSAPRVVFLGEQISFYRWGSRLLMENARETPKVIEYDRYILKRRGQDIVFEDFHLPEDVLVVFGGKVGLYVRARFAMSNDQNDVYFLHSDDRMSQRSLPFEGGGRFTFFEPIPRINIMARTYAKDGRSRQGAPVRLQSDLVFLDSGNGDVKSINVKFKKQRPSNSLSVVMARGVGRNVFVKMKVHPKSDASPNLMLSQPSHVWMKLYRDTRHPYAKLIPVEPKLPSSIHDWGEGVGHIFYEESSKGPLAVRDGHPVYLIAPGSKEPKELYLPEDSRLLPRGFLVSRHPSDPRRYRLYRAQGEKLEQILDPVDPNVEIIPLSNRTHLLRTSKDVGHGLYYLSNVAGAKPVLLLEERSDRKFSRAEYVSWSEGKMVFFQTRKGAQPYEFENHLWMISPDDSRVSTLVENNTLSAYEDVDGSYQFVPNSPLFWKGVNRKYEFYRATQNGMERVILENLDPRAKIFSVKAKDGKLRVAHEFGISIYEIPSKFK